MEFKKLTKEDIVKGLKRALELIKDDFPGKIISYDEAALDYMGELCEGDLRRALNILELILYSNSLREDKVHITVDSVEKFSQKKILNYDRDGDSHYDILSAFQKSIRGSDANAAILYLGMLIKAGDLASICRRLLVIASEDVGLAYPQAISIVKACIDSALQLGFPEARIPLSEAVILLATAPKSNSAILAIDSALKDLETLDVGEIPLYLKDGHYEGAKVLGRMQNYKYPHNYKNSYVEQQYLPDNVKTKQYYSFGNNKMEQISKAYWDKIKEK